jgi:hypothetical protein
MQGWANQVCGWHELSRVIPHTIGVRRQRNKNAVADQTYHMGWILCCTLLQLMKEHSFVPACWMHQLCRDKGQLIHEDEGLLWQVGILYSWQMKLLECPQPAWNCLNMRSHISCCNNGHKQGVCHTMALPFTFKSIWRQKKNYGNSNISPCKNTIFKTSSKRTKILQDIRTL